MHVDKDDLIEPEMTWGHAGRPHEAREVHLLPPHRGNEAQLFLRSEDEFAEEAITLTVPEACVLLPVLKKFIGAHAPEGEVTPGAAAFETWMQVVAVREDGYRNDYWDELSAEERQAWENIAKAALNPFDPSNRPKTRPR